MKERLYGSLAVLKLLKDGASPKFSKEIYEVGKNFVPLTRKVLSELEKNLEDSSHWCYVEDTKVRQVIGQSLKGSRIPYFSTLPVQYCWMRTEGKTSICVKEVPNELKEIEKAFIHLGNGGDLKDTSLDEDLPLDFLSTMSLEEVQNLVQDDELLKETFKEKLGKVPLSFLGYEISWRKGICKLEEVEPSAARQVMKYKSIAESKAGEELFLSSRIRANDLEEVRKNLRSLEDILELQGKLGAIAGGIVSGSLEIYKSDFDPLRNVLPTFFYNLTSFANLVGDDLKEFKEDFKRVGDSIKNPANSLALLLVKEGMGMPNLKKLEEFLNSERGREIFAGMIDFFLEKLRGNVEFISSHGSEVERKLTSYSLGFTFASVSNNLKKFSREFKLQIYPRVEEEVLWMIKKLKE